MTGGFEDSLATKGRATSFSEEILLSHADSPHQGTGHGQEVLSTKVVADGKSFLLLLFRILLIVPAT
jgi:hypothetical protein